MQALMFATLIRSPVDKVVAGGVKWYRMYGWWEIVVYYRNMEYRELVWQSAITNLHIKLWRIARLARSYQVYVNRRIQAHVGSQETAVLAV